MCIFKIVPFYEPFKELDLSDTDQYAEYFGVTAQDLFGLYLNRFIFIDRDEKIAEVMVVVRLEISAQAIIW